MKQLIPHREGAKGIQTRIQSGSRSGFLYDLKTQKLFEIFTTYYYSIFFKSNKKIVIL